MARTPDVVANETITSTWGNEIRDRTNQVFATIAELTGWAAPNGSVAVYMSGITTAPYVRLNGSWIPLSFTAGGFTSGTTNGNGDLLVPHPLLVTPKSIQVTPSYELNVNTAMFTIVNRSAGAFTVRARNFNGLIQANASIGVYWMVSL